MAIQQLKVKLTGAAPLILHNGWLANPLGKFSRAIKEITSKKNKTDADHILLANLEWLACWYYQDGQIEFAVGSNEVIAGDHGELMMPSTVLWAMLVNGAKKNKLGNQFKSGVFVERDAILEFEGKADIGSMMADENFRIVTLEKVQASRVVRTRPYIKKWSVTFAVTYDDTVVNKSQIDQALEVGGRLIGLCERRPSYGRFTYEIVRK
jgi:hypothetical protein